MYTRLADYQRIKDIRKSTMVFYCFFSGRKALKFNFRLLLLSYTTSVCIHANALSDPISHTISSRPIFLDIVFFRDCISMVICPLTSSSHWNIWNHSDFSPTEMIRRYPETWVLNSFCGFRGKHKPAISIAGFLLYIMLSLKIAATLYRYEISGGVIGA